MATFALSLLVMIIVVGTLAGWAIRAERRRGRGDLSTRER